MATFFKNLSKIMRIRALCIVIIFLCGPLPACASSTNGHHYEKSGEYLQRMVYCLVSQKFVEHYALTFDDLKPGDWTLAEYHVGSIVDPAYRSRARHVVIYSANMQKAVVLTVIPSSDGSLSVARTGDFLVKRGRSWAVQEGEGGYRDYEKIGTFVTHLPPNRRYRVHLISREPSCLRQ